jgi:flagellar biosynthesis/type III secretory pathway protein FliH
VGQAEARKIEAEAKQLMARADEKINTFTALVNQIDKQKNSIYLSAEKEILELSLLLARKVIGTDATKNPEIILETIRKSLPILVEKSNLILKVSPDQEDFVRTHLEEIMMMDNELKKIKIETDRRITPGGCILETDSGRVDARLEKQLDTLIDSIKKEIPQE